MEECELLHVGMIPKISPFHVGVGTTTGHLLIPGRRPPRPTENIGSHDRPRGSRRRRRRRRRRHRRLTAAVSGAPTSGRRYEPRSSGNRGDRNRPRHSQQAANDDHGCAWSSPSFFSRLACLVPAPLSTASASWFPFSTVVFRSALRLSRLPNWVKKKKSELPSSGFQEPASTNAKKQGCAQIEET